jgi:DNA-binding transcriptional regulator GbsR (MarR family)
MPRDRLQEFAERLASVFAAAGFPRMAARVLITVVVSPDATLTATQLRERLGVSAAAVSGAVKYLEGLGMLRRLPHAGTRQDLYELPDNGWYTASLRDAPVYTAIAGLMPEGIEAAQAAEAQAAVTRLTEMQEFFEFARTRLPQLLEEWLAERAARAQHADRAHSARS